MKHFYSILVVCLVLVGCQSPTKVIEQNQGLQDSMMGKVEIGRDVQLKHAVIVDVRSRFDHEMSKPPRSFYAGAEDWDLSGLTPAQTEKKAKELQRLLALQGIDPLTHVAILGKGHLGNGEEFLLATTLMSLGVKRISFLSEKQVAEALTARNLPKVENLDYWNKPVGELYACDIERRNLSESDLVKQATVVVSSEPLKSSFAVHPKKVFNKQLKVQELKYPKTLKMQLYSPKGYWSYGLTLYFREQGRQACAL